MINISSHKRKEDLEDLEYYPLIATGEFLHNKEMLVGPRAIGNSQAGYIVITPFKLSDSGCVYFFPLISRRLLAGDRDSNQSYRDFHVVPLFVIREVILVNRGKLPVDKASRSARGSDSYVSLIHITPSTLHQNLIPITLLCTRYLVIVIATFRFLERLSLQESSEKENM